ncbi:hypothetical protein JXC34_03325 [Candidatus Woesearchaeota archaeon]|nr:hypothetical protein [Candidatus Woesearchaeota archaeon]
MEKEEPKWVPQIFKFLSDLITTLVHHSDFEIKKLKEKAVKYVIVYGLFLFAILFVLIGLIKYLDELHVFPSEGVGFMVVGSVLIVILAAYSLVSKV